MKERPILFSGPMVRAILDGRKTQTRRIIKDTWISDGGVDAPYLCAGGTKKSEGGPDQLWMSLKTRFAPIFDPPYGKPGDRLWVRETFCGDQGDLRYAADGDSTHNFKGWQPSIHMPRWASRITLEITDVRVERLQEINEQDAIDEGVMCFECIKARRGCDTHDLRFWFKELWSTIHAADGPNGWAANPWVWVVSFKVLTTTEREG